MAPHYITPISENMMFDDASDLVVSQKCQKIVGFAEITLISAFLAVTYQFGVKTQ